MLGLVKTQIYRIIPICRGLFGNVLIEINSITGGHYPPGIDLSNLENILKIICHLIITGVTLYYTIKGAKVKNNG